MKKKKKVIKIPYDFPQVQKTPLYRLAGIVIGSQVSLIGEKSFVLRFLVPFIIVSVYFFSALLLLPFTAGNLSFSTPMIPLFSFPLSLLPFIAGKASYVLLIVCFSLGGLLWYRLIQRISGRIFIAFLTVMLWISPIFAVAINELFIKVPPQLFLGFMALDLPHIVGLSYIPIPIFLTTNFLKDPTHKNFILSLSSISFIALISPFALINLLFFLLVLGCSEMLLGQGRIKFLRLMFAVVCGLTFTAFWYHPSFVISLINSREWQPTIAAIRGLIPLAFFIIPITGTILFLIFDRKPQLQVVFATTGLLILYGLIYFSENVLEQGVIPVPIRFFPEFSLSLSLLIAVIAANTSHFIAILSIKIRKEQSWFFERLPYGISSFILGFVITWTIVNLINSYLLIQNTHFETVNVASMVTSSSPDTVWLSQSGSIISNIIGIVISFVVLIFLIKIRSSFKEG